MDDARTDEAAARIRAATIGTLGPRFTTGNSIDVLKNGIQIFPAMLSAIQAAERSIEFVTFVYWQGEVARNFAHALAERSANGVAVRVILDGFGSAPMNTELVEEMRRAGVEVERFRPPVRWKAWEADHRTHRKILVIDDRVAFTGGVGIAEEWEGDARDASEWRDTHFRVQGPSVMGLKAAFLTDWRDSDRRMTAYDIAPNLPQPAGDVEIAVMNASAQIGYNEAERVLEALLSAARERILIQTPYFNPSDVVHEVLSDARRRAVEVDLMVPGEHIDKRISAVKARESYRPLIQEGVRVWEYRPSMLHTKSLMIDGVASIIGSVNINKRSVEKDEEVGLIVIDRAVTQILEDHFEADRRSCDPISYEEATPGIVGKVAEKMLKPLDHEM